MKGVESFIDVAWRMNIPLKPGAWISLLLFLYSSLDLSEIEWFRVAAPSVEVNSNSASATMQL